MRYNSYALFLQKCAYFSLKHITILIKIINASLATI